MEVPQKKVRKSKPKSKDIGFPLKAVSGAPSASQDGQYYRCAGFQRYGAPCKWKVLKRGEKCWRHANDPKQAEKEQHGRDLVARGRRVTSVMKIPRRWYEVEMNLREKGLDWQDLVKTLDPEELARGQLKERNGRFSGKPPAWVPNDFHAACVTELMSRGREVYRTAFLDSVRYFSAVVNNEDADPTLRLRAAQYIWERVEGKIPEKVEVSESAPWQDAMAEAIVTEEEMIERAKEKLGRIK